MITFLQFLFCLWDRPNFFCVLFKRLKNNMDTLILTKIAFCQKRNIVPEIPYLLVNALATNLPS